MNKKHNPKTEVIIFRLTPKEKKRLTVEASSYGKSLSSLVRHKLDLNESPDSW